jgi:diguanylate cyclase (GGDEF)-like protein
LENLSVTDGLTGIANRRRFDEFLLNEWRRAVRYRTPLSLILLDIDSFKAYNDYYGHLSGDDCLRQVAQCLKETIQRPGDLLARFGGEEFACVLTITQAKGARALAGQIAKKIRAMKIPHDASPVADRVTVTIGVVTTFPTAEEQPQDLIRKADELLYEGKRSGRNRIKYWPETKSKA